MDPEGQFRIECRHEVMDAKRKKWISFDAISFSTWVTSWGIMEDTIFSSVSFSKKFQVEEEQDSEESLGPILLAESLSILLRIATNKIIIARMIAKN